MYKVAQTEHIPANRVTKHKIAVLIPCYNEEKTIGKVITDFKKLLPDATVYVCDNNSTDHTVAEAIKAGAVVGYEKRQGKGFAVRTMFENIDADIYVMVDGDGTYPPEKVLELISPIVNNNADMVVGSRLHNNSTSAFKKLNKFGNKLFLLVLNTVFSTNVKITDLLSGYRAFSKRMVKTVPFLSKGFEIETEITIKAIERGFVIEEIPVNLTNRVEGSTSKIKIVKDGILILKTILSMFRDYRPLAFFGTMGVILCLFGLLSGAVVIREYIQTGFIKHLPTAVLATGLVLSGLLVFLSGMVLHVVTRHFREIYRQMERIELHSGEKSCWQIIK